MNNKTAYFIIGVLIIGALIFREQPPPLRTVLYKSHIISLLGGGNIEALRTSDCGKDKELTKALKKYDPEILFSDSKTLAMINREKAFVWSDEKFEWLEVGKLPAAEETPLDIVMSNNKIFVIYPSKILEPSGNKAYIMPDQIKLTSSGKGALTAVHAGADKLWLSALSGKGGGHLLILDIKSGKWNQILHIDRYINSFAEDVRGIVWVVWVRSNFADGVNLDADTVLSSLSSNGYPLEYNGFLQGHYIQAIAYNKYDSHLYGISRNDLVRFNPGSVDTIAGMGEMRFIKDAAAGVLPAIDDLLIVDRAKFVIPHKIDGLFLYEKGKIRKIEESKSTAYWFKIKWARLSRIFGRLREKVWT